MKLRRALALLIAVPLAAGASATVPVMLNLDGDLSFRGATPAQSEARLAELVDTIARMGVTTLAYSIGAGSDILYYPTRAASTWGWRTTPYDTLPEWRSRIARCRAAIDSGLDAPRIAGRRAGERGMRFIPSYRMNDAHYCSDPENHPLTGRFWIEHRNATIGASPVPGHEPYRHLLNFARADVRAHRLAVIGEAIDRYADLMDGFELDFNRFQIFFPPGEADRHAPLMTELVAQARARLDAAAARVGRPLTLVVRVPPALRNCRWSGLDVAQWMRRRLIDVVIPSQVMTLSHDMPLDEFVRMAAPAGCAVFGSLHGRAGYSWPFSAVHDATAYSAEVTRTPTAAQVLGAALNLRYLGADGFELFNFGFFSADPPMMSAVVSGLIDPRTIARGDRRYQVTPAYFHDADDTYEYRKQLPGALEPGRTLTLRLLIGEELAKADPRSACVALRFGFHGANRAYGAVALAVRVNDRPVHNGPAAGRLIVTTGRRHGMGSHPPPTEAYLQLPIDDLTLLRPGWNTVHLTLDPATRTPPLQCVEAELGVAEGR